MPVNDCKIGNELDRRIEHAYSIQMIPIPVKGQSITLFMIAAQFSAYMLPRCSPALLID